MATVQPGSNTGGLTTTPTYAAPFINPLGSQLADYTAGLFNQPINLQGMMPQVAGQNVLQQSATTILHNKSLNDLTSFS